MTNEEVGQKAHEEFTLRGMSKHIYVLCGSLYATMRIALLKLWAKHKF